MAADGAYAINAESGCGREATRHALHLRQVWWKFSMKNCYKAVGMFGEFLKTVTRKAIGFCIVGIIQSTLT